MSNPYPHELAIGDVYFSPVLAALTLALAATWLTVIVLNKLRLSRFVLYPSTTFLAIMVFYVVALDHWLIRF
jgi:hypothetical protein